MDGHLEESHKIKQRKYIYHWWLLEDTEHPSHYSLENLLDQTRHNVPLFIVLLPKFIYGNPASVSQVPISMD